MKRPSRAAVGMGKPADIVARNHSTVIGHRGDSNAYRVGLIEHQERVAGNGEIERAFPTDIARNLNAVHIRVRLRIRLLAIVMRLTLPDTAIEAAPGGSGTEN